MPSIQPPVDVLLVGAGISGINAAYQLQTQRPGTNYVTPEASDTLGGIWAFWKYPGPRNMVDGGMIQEYPQDAASKHGIDKRILFQHKVLSAEWSSATQRWEVMAKTETQQKQFMARFLFLGTGIVDHENRFDAPIPGLERFKASCPRRCPYSQHTRTALTEAGLPVVINPQRRPSDYDLTGRKAAPIGGGATGISMLPAMPDKVSRVTMIPRTWCAATTARPGRTTTTSLPLRPVNLAKRLWLTFPALARPCARDPEAVIRARPKPQFEPRYAGSDEAGTAAVGRPGPEGAPRSTFKSPHRPTVRLPTAAAAAGLGGGGRGVDRVLRHGAMVSGARAEPRAALNLGYAENAWTPGAPRNAGVVLLRLLARRHEGDGEVVGSRVDVQRAHGAAHARVRR
ncbi:hypothetical protein F4780DRAFT_783515 [Xylariomycetidae sp. FL0641]|nr:hypothetical protein F4780DRAFT_783515 [Xylariomycetidae sp. FL0641]